MNVSSIEGYVVRLIDDSLWIARWNIHDDLRRIIALPYYAMMNGKPLLIIGYMNAIKYIRVKYSHLLNLVESYDRFLPVVTRNIIKSIKSPKAILRETMDKRNHLLKTITDFLLLVSSEANISINDLGASFIPEVLLYQDVPKIDFIVYGEENSFKVHSGIRRLFFTTDMFNHLTGKYVLNNREKYDLNTSISEGILTSIYSRKFLSGFFNNKIEFNIRLVHDRLYGFDEMKVSNLGRVTVLAKITNDKYAIFTPAEYGVKVKSVAEGDSRAKLVSKIVAFNDGFREHAWRGIEVLVQGSLEKVYDIANDKEYYRITLGFSHDLLLPVQRPYAPLYS